MGKKLTLIHGNIAVSFKISCELYYLFEIQNEIELNVQASNNLINR